mgnify:CR=1 FL=1
MLETLSMLTNNPSEVSIEISRPAYFFDLKDLAMNLLPLIRLQDYPPPLQILGELIIRFDFD